MALSSDAKTFALYNLTSGGTNLGPGGTVWSLTAAGDGSFSRDAHLLHLVTFASGQWTVEAELTLAGDGGGTILELGGWGESESVNIQAVIGWTADRRLFMGWETGSGTDRVLTSTAALPLGTPLRVAAVADAGHLYLVANGSKIGEAFAVPPPTGGATGGAPTPGTKLSVRKRVSAASGVSSEVAWVRLSDVRTVDEMNAEWAATAPAHVIPSSTWEDLARRDNARVYYVFRGRFRALDDSPGEVVNWATAPVRHPDDGLIPGRLTQAPGGIVAGFPETFDAMPERTSSALALDNLDHALTPYFAGGAEDASAYTADSFLNLTGSIWMGLVGDDGAILERKLTPTLELAGEPTSVEGKLVLPLATSDDGILGESQKMLTVRQIKDAPAIGGGEGYLLNGDAITFPNAQWAQIQGKITESLDTIAPYAFGRSAIELTPLTKDGWFLAFLSLSEPKIDDATAWEFEQEAFGDHEFRTDQLWLWKIQVTAKQSDGQSLDVWVVGLRMLRVDEQVAGRRSFLIPPASNFTGMAPGVLSTAANVIKQIVTDLSKLGAAAIDSASFRQASKAVPMAGLCGGVVKSGAALAEILAHICGAFGLSLWVGTDNRLHVMAGTSRDADAQATAQGDLPRLRLGDVMEGTWKEWIPFGNARGAAATRVSIAWSGEQADFWPAGLRPSLAPGVSKMKFASATEARISGAWLFPPTATTALRGVGSRRAFVYRQIEVVTAPWVPAMGLGTMFRISHPFGADPGGTGYRERLVRLTRFELMPAEHAARCQFEDLGPLEELRVGKLDSIANWLRYAPSADNCALMPVAGDTKITLDTGVADPSWVGCTLGIWRPGDPANHGVYRITGVGDANTIEVDRPIPADDYIDSPVPCPAIDEPWIVLQNRGSAGWSYRPDYITLANEETAEHSDGSPGFVMMT